MRVRTKKILYCIWTTIQLSLIYSTNAGSQIIEKANDNLWLQTITHNAVKKTVENNIFPRASTGYALYFSEVDTIQVPYLVYVPLSYDPLKHSPLIVYLHGGVVSIDSFMYKTPVFKEEPVFSIAEKNNAIVLFPFGRKSFGWVKQEKAFTNILSMISQVKQKYYIDSSEIYLGGMSNGGTAAFWFVSNAPDVFAGFYAFSPMPELEGTEIKFNNITTNKPMYSVNAVDDEGFGYNKVKGIYDTHKGEAPGWCFDSTYGGHGFLYDDGGMAIADNLFDQLFKTGKNTCLTNQNKDSLIKELSEIQSNDQVYRAQMEGIREKYGGDSKEMRALIGSMNETDSANFVKVSLILDTYGWLGPDIIGREGNDALFMVVQHTGLPGQEKYLPLMRAGVRVGKTRGSYLALLEDRVALRQHKRQIYGSQVGWNMKNNTYYVLPLDMPDSVDQRRSVVGLQPLADYLSNFQIKWDAEQYKKDLPGIELEFYKQ